MSDDDNPFETIPNLEGIFEDPSETYAATFMLGMKNSLVADNPHGGNDITTPPPVIAAFRGGEMIGWIIGYQADRNVALEAAELAILGWGCDALMMSNDARMRTDVTPEDLDAGRYKRGEFQRMAEEEGSDILGITIECMAIQVMRRDGHHQMVTAVYQMRRDDEGHGSIHWLPVESHKSDGHLAGFISETVDKMFVRQKEVPDIGSLGTESFGLSAEAARIHADMAVLKLMLDRNLHVMYNANTPEKEAILRASTESGVLAGSQMLPTHEAGEIDDDGKLT